MTPATLSSESRQAPRSKEQVLASLQSLSSSSDSSASQLYSAFMQLIDASSSLVQNAISSAKSGDWSSSKASMNELFSTSEFEALRAEAASSGFKSIGLVGCVEAGLIVSGKGTLGIITGTDNLSQFYSYESVGASAGLTEGVTGLTGLIVSTDSPSNMGGTEIFGKVSVALGAGVAVESFTHIFGSGSGILILVSGGMALR